MIVIILLLVFMDMFNMIGTLVEAAAQAGIMTKDGRVPHMKEALMAGDRDNNGAALGTSTVTTYVESAAGIAEGIALGLLSYTGIKVLTGQYRKVSIMLYILSALFILRYVWG